MGMNAGPAGLLFTFGLFFLPAYLTARRLARARAWRGIWTLAFAPGAPHGPAPGEAHREGPSRQERFLLLFLGLLLAYLAWRILALPFPQDWRTGSIVIPEAGEWIAANGNFPPVSIGTALLAWERLRSRGDRPLLLLYYILRPGLRAGIRLPHRAGRGDDLSRGASADDRRGGLRPGPRLSGAAPGPATARTGFRPRVPRLRGPRGMKPRSRATDAPRRSRRTADANRRTRPGSTKETGASGGCARRGGREGAQRRRARRGRDGRSSRE